MRIPARLMAILALMAPLAAAAEADDAFVIRTLSTHPDTVSGGDVLVRVDVPRGVPFDSVVVSVNGTDTSAAFSPDDSARTLTGLVTGLSLGENTLRVQSGGPDDRSAELTIINHPITGPVFSGPQEKPFECETATFQRPAGLPGLGASSKPDCSIATRVDYLYKSTKDGKLKPLTSTAVYPADVAFTTSPATGKPMPYIVRLETGTIDRSIYEIAVLHDPIADKQQPGLRHRSAGWNGRLVFTFGGGCTTGWYRQGTSTGGVLDDVQLRQGYAVASSSLNVFGNNCNDLLASEAMMMVKEHFIETYGPPLFTIGWGCSGGSYQQHQIGDNYPGLLDGIIPGCSFPEVGFATIQFITDARLLNHYFTKVNPGAFSEKQQRKVAGFLNLKTTANVAFGAGRITPTEFCPAALPAALRYDKTTNPAGARCDVYDHTINVYGRDPATHFARRPLDNVGIQYGLGALDDGTIDVDRFLDLNAGIGGYDEDGGYQVARNVADLQAVRAAYQTGRLTNGGGGLRDLPIIDYRAYNDDAPGGDIHLRFHSFSMRTRLIKANGNADNQVMWVEDQTYGLYSSRSPVLASALAVMDRWLVNLSRDTSADPQSVKVVRAKPTEAVDACWRRQKDGYAKIVEPQTRTGGECSTIYPPAPFPREVAGSSVASDIIKCQLKALDPTDYKVKFTPAQWERLQSTFPAGVCDWTKPGVEQQGLIGTWISFDSSDEEEQQGDR
ncbi:MAG: DUF6351 family protein [Myxococcales bacterium]